MRILKTLFIAILFFIGIAFAVENDGNVILSYYRLGAYETPVFIVVLVSVFIGLVIAGFVGFLEGIKHKRELSRLKKKIKKDEEELNSLRNLPLSDSSDPSDSPDSPETNT